MSHMGTSLLRASKAESHRKRVKDLSIEKTQDYIDVEFRGADDDISVQFILGHRQCSVACAPLPLTFSVPQPRQIGINEHRYGNTSALQSMAST